MPTLAVTIKRKDSLSNKYFIGDNQILCSTTVKDLGVMISSNLKWSCHISQIVSFALTCSYRVLKSISGSNIWPLLTAYTADSMTYARSKL